MWWEATKGNGLRCTVANLLLLKFLFTLILYHETKVMVKAIVISSVLHNMTSVISWSQSHKSTLRVSQIHEREGKHFQSGSIFFHNTESKLSPQVIKEEYILYCQPRVIKANQLNYFVPHTSWHPSTYPLWRINEKILIISIFCEYYGESTGNRGALDIIDLIIAAQFSRIFFIQIYSGSFSGTINLNSGKILLRFQWKEVFTSPAILPKWIINTN